jgi:hypothetical protein
VLKLMFGALIRVADRWRGLRFTEFELRLNILPVLQVYPRFEKKNSDAKFEECASRFWSDSFLMCRIWMAFDRRQDLAKISVGPRGSDSTCCALRSPVPYPPSRLLRFQPLAVH